MGPKSCEEVLKPLTRLGAKVKLISDNAFAGSDTLVTSYILSTAIKQMEYDLILCGRQSVDGDTAQVGPMLSQKLSIPVITNAMQVSCNDGVVFAKTRDSEEKVSLPALVTVERGYVLRFPSIFSKIGDVEIIDNTKLGCDISKCGLGGSPTRVLAAFENESGKRKCKFITKDELIPLVNELVKLERGGEKQAFDGTKLKSVWAVGEEVIEKAKEISEEVVFIEKTTPEEIAKKAIEEKPDVILWNADLWGRKNAPIVAAMLDTGLCADCTALETDGEKLYMYRPACSGNVIAKIECRTKPQMATVRTISENAEIIVAGGKGVAEKIDNLKAFAAKYNAEICASRGLVDMNKMPYPAQVGLTGKVVSPKIYIAVGISGAVHHTCAIENADTVIAINPDKDARIFEYADYGILSDFT
jgi:electron transfer flavoprotein alpha subunit